MKYFKIIFFALIIPILSNAQAVYFRLGTESDIQGTEVVIPVTVENFNSIVSIQGTISFNPSVVSFVNAESFGLTNLNTSNFGLSNVSSGKLTFSWYDPDLSGETISLNDTIFCLRFSLIGSSGMSSIISIDNSITPIEVIHSSLIEKLVYTQSGLISITNTSASNQIMLSVASDEGSTGQTIQIPVIVRDFNSIVSIQGSILFDPAVISFISIDGYGLSGMNSGNFGTTTASSGILSFSWNDPSLSGVSLVDNSEIFVLNFEITGTSGQSSPISLTSSPTPLEFVNSSIEVLDYTLSQGLVTVGSPFIPENVVLTADSVEGAIGQYVQVSVKTTDFNDIIAMQGSLSFDPSVAQFDQITNFGLPDMSAANFGTSLSGTGNITFSWNDTDLSGESVSDNSILFTVQFLLIGNIGDQTPVSFTNIPTPFEFIKSDFSESGYSATSGNIKIIDLYGLNVLSISNNELCAGAQLSVQYSAVGDFTATNIFTAYLSDENGSFTSPVSIGSIISNVSGTIDAIIPANTVNGTNYKIKIEASDPFYSGTVGIPSITVHALPTADAGTDVDICTGNSANLSATGGVDFEWNSGQTSASISVSPLVDTEYTVTVTDVYGCENSDAVMVFVHSLPVANAGTDQNICFGETANISATGGVSYEWNSGQLIADITVAPTITTDYIVTVTDIWSCENTDTVTVNVFQVFANAGTDEEICSGVSVTLIATGGSSYEWNSGPTTDVINVSPLVDTEYIVTVTGVNSCQDVDTVLVTVHALPTADAGTDVDICTGNSANLSATGGVDFEWNSGQTSASISVSPLVDTEYTVTVTDVYGCENSDAVMVFVHSLPVANAGTDQNICFGETANLSATGGVSYEWNSGQLIADITVAPTITTDYIVTVTDIWSCENTDTITINVFQVFANAGTDKEICSGGSVTLTATGGSSYQWNNSQTTDVINVSPLADTEYIVTVTGVNSCQDIDTVLVTVHALPTADAGTDVDICTGNAANITAIGGVDFEWNSGQTSASISVSPLVDTEYTVTVTDVYGCENSDAVMVFVHSLPVANAGTDQNICFGETADLSATGGVSYEWNSGQLIADITVAPTITTDYIVTVTDIWSCENTDTVTVNVFQVFANAGTDEEICSGGSVTLTATGGSSYEWNSGPTTDVINVSPLADTEYIVTVTGVNSCQDIDTVLVTVHALPTADAGSDIDICTGNPANLSATGGVDFEWNGGQTSATISVSPLVDTEYTVTVTDVYGCENSDAVMVFVHSLPVANAGTDQNICFGETADLSVTGGVSYEWNSGQLIADITVAPTITTDYIVTVTDIWSCENADTITINVFQVFANAGTDKEICSGGSVTLTATGGSSYQWNNSQTTDVINVSPLADTEYIVTVTGVNSCQDIDTVLVTVHALPTADAGTDIDICTGNPANLSVTGGVDFEWNGGQTSATISVSPLVDTEYTVTVTDVYGCENSDAVMVFVHSLPVANAGTDQNICFGETANISATGGVSYEWNSGHLVADITVAPTITTDYIVTVTDIWSCENTDTVTVNVFQVFANAGTDEEICSGGSVTLTATGGSSYEWNSGPTTDVINVSPLADTEYIVTVTGVNSCQDIDTVLVTVHALPTADAGTDVDICTGNAANLTAIGGVDFEWNSGQTSATISVSPLVDTEYTVTVTDVYGCENSDAVMVFVHSLPVANAGTDQNICFGETADLSATGGVSYEWNSGQLIADITVAPTITTDYIVTVTDIWSCENTDTVTVNVFQVFANAGIDKEICSGGSVTLTATGGSSYQWNNSQTTDVINVSPLVDTEYIVTVTGVNSCQDVDTVLVMVLGLPEIPETPTGITERCQSIETTEFSISEVSGADTYIWTVFPEESGSNTPDQNILTLNWNINFTGISGIYVEAVNTCGITRSDTIYVQTNPSPFPTLGNDTTICSGNFLTLDAGYAETWNWTNGYTSQTIETNEAGTLGVEVFIGSCSNYDEITIFVSNPEVDFGQDTIHSDAAVILDAGTGFSEYLWNDNSTEQTLLAENPGWYFITVTNEFGCTDYDSIYVDITSGIKFTLEPQISIYPSPVEDKLIVKIDSKYSKIVKIELIGIDSKIIESRAFNGVSNLDEYFDMNGFATGIYLLRIEFENDLKLFKILKQ